MLSHDSLSFTCHWYRCAVSKLKRSCSCLMLEMDARFPRASVIVLFVLLFHPQPPVGGEWDPEMEMAGHWSRRGRWSAGGHWSPWSELGPCSVTCGSGISMKFRGWVAGPGESPPIFPILSTRRVRCTDETYPECPGTQT